MGPKMGPKWGQNGSKNGSKMTKMGPKWGQNGAVQNGSKMGPQWVQNGFKIGPNWSKTSNLFFPFFVRSSAPTGAAGSAYCAVAATPRARSNWHVPYKGRLGVLTALLRPRRGSVQTSSAVAALPWAREYESTVAHPTT